MAGYGQRRFEFVDCLGRGGFGEVYRARLLSPGGLQSIAAVKVLRRELSLDGDAVRRLRDEGRLLARLDHPTILRAHDLVRLDGRLALVTEFVDGADLSDLFRSDPPLPARPLVEVIGRVAAALDAALQATGPDGRSLSLVHRDIKPTNIRVGRFGEVKLLDFGIAHFKGDDREARTATHVMVGSLPYMAPERFVDREARSASDVFALGCTLFQGLSGRRFIERADVIGLGARALDPAAHEAHLSDRMALLAPGAESRAALLELLTAMLAWDHDARPTPAEVASRCEQLVEALPGPRLRTWCRERRWPGPQPRAGELVGRTLTEETVDLDRPPRIQPPATAEPTRASFDPKALGGRHLAVVGCGVAGLAIGLVVSGMAAFIVALAMFAAS